MKADLRTIACNYLRTGILNGDFPNGAPIREMEIAETLQMSRAPIREAIRLLESEGVLVSYPSRGAFVASLTLRDVQEICQLRILLELYALDVAFDSYSAEEFEEFRLAFQQSYVNHDWETYHLTDRQFHDLLVGKCGLSRLTAFLDTLNFQIERLRRFMEQSPQRMAESYEAHLRIIEYICKKERQMAKLELERHLRAVIIASAEAYKEFQSE